MPIHAFRSDADGPSFLGEQLEYIFPQTVNIVYAPDDWAKHLPLETGDDPAVEAVGFDIYSATGMAELFEGNGWNLPEVGVARERILAPVLQWGINHAMDDLATERAALEAARRRQAGVTGPVITLNVAKELAAAESIRQRHNALALFGSANQKIYGLVNQPNIANYPAPAGEGGTSDWESKSGPEIVADLTALVSLVMNTAKADQWFPNRIVLSMNKYLIASSKMMPGTLETALSFFQRTNPMGTTLRVEPWIRLNGQGSGSTGIAFCYRFDDQVISYVAPLPYKVNTPPARAPAGWTWTHSMRSAGVSVKRPFAVAKMQGF